LYKVKWHPSDEHWSDWDGESLDGQFPELFLYEGQEYRKNDFAAVVLRDAKTLIEKLSHKNFHRYRENQFLRQKLEQMEVENHRLKKAVVKFREDLSSFCGVFNAAYKSVLERESRE
jgi:FtsZ-binding cell division protein ZapB